MPIWGPDRTPIDIEYSPAARTINHSTTPLKRNWSTPGAARRKPTLPRLREPVNAASPGKGSVIAAPSGAATISAPRAIAALFSAMRAVCWSASAILIAARMLSTRVITPRRCKLCTMREIAR